MFARLMLSLGLSLLFSWGMALVTFADVAGSLTIAGNGPELTTIEPLARAFEKANPRAYLDVLWDTNSKPVEMVKSGQAHVAVTGTEAPGLSATPIAWDGIGVLVHLSNFTKDVTMQQVADIFSGKTTLWSDVGGP
jgi:phosphate transport system substrate-binding protein